MDIGTCIEAGKVLMKRGEYAEARECFAGILKIAPENGEALFELGKLYYMTGEYVKAAGMLKKAMKRQPGNMHVHLLLGKAYREAGKRELAIGIFKGMVAKGFACSEAYRELGWLYREKGKREQAEKMYREYVERERGDGETVKVLVRLYREGGKHGEIVALYEHIGGEAWERGELCRELATAYRETGEYGEALKRLEKAEDEGWVHLERGRTYRCLGETEKAAAGYRTALEQNGGDDALRYTLGCLYRELEQYGAAADVFAGILDAGPYKNLYRELAELFIRQRKYDAAIAVLKKALRTEPSSYPVNFALMRIYGNSGRFDAALRQYGKIRTAGHDSAELHFEAARAYRKTGKYVTATGCAVAGLRMNGDYEAANAELKAINDAEKKGAAVGPGTVSRRTVTRPPFRPTTLMIVPTRKCNIRCIMCRDEQEKATLP
jgi:tetratricopeptide (TPR) repeat protein